MAGIRIKLENKSFFIVHDILIRNNCSVLTLSIKRSDAENTSSTRRTRIRLSSKFSLVARRYSSHYDKERKSLEQCFLKYEISFRRSEPKLGESFLLRDSPCCGLVSSSFFPSAYPTILLFESSAIHNSCGQLRRCYKNSLWKHCCHSYTNHLPRSSTPVEYILYNFFIWKC